MYPEIEPYPILRGFRCDLALFEAICNKIVLRINERVNFAGNTGGLSKGQCCQHSQVGRGVIRNEWSFVSLVANGFWREEVNYCFVGSSDYLEMLSLLLLLLVQLAIQLEIR